MSVEDAERLFTSVFFNLTAQWGEASEFRRIAGLGEPRALTQLHRENLDFAERMITDPELRQMFTAPEEMVAMLGGLTGVQEALSDRQTQSFRRSVDSGAMVFMHAALDAAVSDLCRVTSLVAPEDWEQFIGGRKVALSEVKAQGYAQLFAAKLSAALEALERESLLKRADRLFALCRPEVSLIAVKGFEYDRDRLKLLDDYRHAVLHRTRKIPDIGDIGAALSDLLNSGLHLFGMVNRRYEVKVNPIYVFEPAVQGVILDSLSRSKPGQEPV